MREEFGRDTHVRKWDFKEDQDASMSEDRMESQSVDERGLYIC